MDIADVLVTRIPLWAYPVTAVVLSLLAAALATRLMPPRSTVRRHRRGAHRRSIRQTAR